MNEMHEMNEWNEMKWNEWMNEWKMRCNQRMNEWMNENGVVAVAWCLTIVRLNDENYPPRVFLMSEAR